MKIEQSDGSLVEFEVTGKSSPTAPAPTTPPDATSGGEIAAIRARLAKITPGEWWVDEYINEMHDKVLHVRQPHEADQYGICEIFGEPDGEDDHVRSDAQFIANAPADIRALLAALGTANAEIARLTDENTDIDHQLAYREREAKNAKLAVVLAMDQRTADLATIETLRRQLADAENALGVYERRDTDQ